MFLCSGGLADAHSFDRFAVDLAGYREVINQLKPTHCLCSLRVSNAVNRAAIVTEFSQLFLCWHRKRCRIVTRCP